MAKLLFFKPRLNTKPSFKLGATLTLLILSQLVVADQRPLYQWQDTQGLWHFSDRKPLDSKLTVNAVNLKQGLRPYTVKTTHPGSPLDQPTNQNTLEHQVDGENTRRYEICSAKVLSKRVAIDTDSVAIGD